MMPYSKIKKYYFTVCAALFVLLLLLTLLKNNWMLSPRAFISLLVGWLVICAVIIGVIYMLAVKGGKGKEDRGDGRADGGPDNRLME